MRRGRWAGLWRATGQRVLGLVTLCGNMEWMEFHGRLTPPEADGSGSGSPQSGVVGTAWNSGRIGGCPSPQGIIPQCGREPLKQPPGIHLLASVPLCDPSPFLPSQGAWRRIPPTHSNLQMRLQPWPKKFAGHFLSSHD